MANYVPGQLVRVVRDNHGQYPQIVGKETIIVGGYDLYSVNEGGPEHEFIWGYQVDYVMLGLGPLERSYGYFVCEEDELEPVLPTGDEIRETEELYEPEATEEDIYVLSRP